MSATDSSDAGRDDASSGRDGADGGGSWTRVYALVLAALALDVALLWLLGRTFG